MKSFVKEQVNIWFMYKKVCLDKNMYLAIAKFLVGISVLYFNLSTAHKVEHDG